MGRCVVARALPVVAAAFFAISPAVAWPENHSTISHRTTSPEPDTSAQRARIRMKPDRPGPPGDALPRVPPAGLQEPALARGYADGFLRGLGDGRDGFRYDPIRHQEYRDADPGYSATYGSRDAYRNNYRAGFRQGYEEGYRDGTGKR